MYEKILVPLDGSKVGEAVLPHVEELVSKLVLGVKVEVILLKVISSVTYAVTIVESSVQVPYTEKEIEQIKKKAMEYLDKAGESLRSKGATVKTKVATGRAAEEIIKVADETKAGLIAMSTHGRSGLSRLTCGSITDKVLRTGNVLVLVVRTPKATDTNPSIKRSNRASASRLPMRKLNANSNGNKSQIKQVPKMW